MASELNVGGAHIQADIANVRIEGTNDSQPTSVAELIIEASADRRAGVRIEDRDDGTQSGFIGRGYDTPDVLVFETGTTERMRIDSAGLVKVSKGHTGTFTALSLGNTSTSANDNVSLELQAAGLGAPARIEAEAPGGSDTDLAFYTVNGGSAGLAMRLDADGAATFSNGIDISSGFLTVGDYSELTIASGVITVTASLHNVDTESDAATDDLDTINGGAEGTILHFSPTNASRTVVAKDGTCNLRLAGDFTMDNSTDVLTLIKTGSNWFEVSRSNNAG